MSVVSGKYIKLKTVGNPYLSLNDTIKINSNRIGTSFFYFIDDFEVNFTPNNYENVININKQLTVEIFGMIKNVVDKKYATETGIVVGANVTTNKYSVSASLSKVLLTDVPAVYGLAPEVNDKVVITYIENDKLRPVITSITNKTITDQNEREIEIVFNESIIPTVDLNAESGDAQVILNWS